MGRRLHLPLDCRSVALRRASWNSFLGGVPAWSMHATMIVQFITSVLVMVIWRRGKRVPYYVTSIGAVNTPVSHFPELPADHGLA